MNAFTTRYILLLTSFLMIAGGGVGALMYYIFPQYYPQWFGGIIAFFFLTESVMVYIVEKESLRQDARKLVNLYMGIRVSKLLLALAFILVYALVVKEGIKSFVLIFMLIYFLCIIFDTYYFSKIEKRIKEKEINDSSI